MRLCFLLLILGCCFAAGKPPDNETILRKMEACLKNKSFNIEKNLRRAGNQTIEVEVFIAMPADKKLFAEIFSDTRRYSEWALHKINERPNGGQYFMQILDLVPLPMAGHMIDAKILFSLPLFNQNSQRQFRLQPQTKGDWYTLEIEAQPSPSATITNAKGLLKAYCPTGKDNLLWVYVAGEAILGSRLLYELLPDAALNKDAVDRIQIIVDNYLAEESRRRSVERNISTK